MIYELDFVILDKILKVKKLLFAVCISASTLSFAQDYSVPAASPRQKVEQQFSMSKISVDYGRPGVKGRKIFGELVPYGQVWRAGANSSTKITFGQSVNFGGKTVPAGTYGLFIVPTEKDWKVILNKDFDTSYSPVNNSLTTPHTASSVVLSLPERNTQSGI